MSYSPTVDFLGLMRRDAAGAVQLERMPGLDYVVVAMARAGLFNLSIGQTAPLVNRPTTVWFQPAEPSWTAEGVVRLWNSVTGAYELATPALWLLFLSPTNTYVFQSVNAITKSVLPNASLVAVQRNAPAATTLLLPSVASRNSVALPIADWSTNVVQHVITLTPQGAETVMRAASWQLYSTPDQLAGATLYPSIDLNGWVIAP